MEDDDPAMLHEPDLMLTILRAALQGPASIDDAMVRLQANLAAAHEPLPEPEGDLRRRRSNVRRCFSGAPTRSPLPATTGSVLPGVAPGCSPNTRTASTSRCCSRSPSFALS